MKIGELAKRTGTRVETIRFYEREGLLPPISRNPGNYRLYTDAQLERLTFIRHCRHLDMTLAEIRTLLGFKESPAENCGEVNRLLDAHIEHLVRRIEALQALEHQLRALRRRCHTERSTATCAILDGLSQPARITNEARSR